MRVNPRNRLAELNSALKSAGLQSTSSQTSTSPIQRSISVHPFIEVATKLDQQLKITLVKLQSAQRRFRLDKLLERTQQAARKPHRGSFSNPNESSATTLSSTKQHDELDQSTAKFLKNTVAQLEELKQLAQRQIEREKINAHVTEQKQATDMSLVGTHWMGIVLILNERLREVSKVADQFRRTRLQALLDEQLRQEDDWKRRKEKENIPNTENDDDPGEDHEEDLQSDADSDADPRDHGAKDSGVDTGISPNANATMGDYFVMPGQGRTRKMLRDQFSKFKNKLAFSKTTADEEDIDITPQMDHISSSSPKQAKREAETKEASNEIAKNKPIMVQNAVSEEISAYETSAQMEQVFREESSSLRAHLASQYQELEIAQRKMVEIALLNQAFAAKVVDQAAEVETIYELALQSRVDVKRANVELDKMNQGSKDFRRYVILFLFVMAFSLLFLDWFYS